MNTKFHNSENGQAIVYLVIGLVVFLGFVALAIDGGMALADRRNSQNATDAASLAGGGEAAYTLENLDINSWDWNQCHNNNITTALTNAENSAISRANANDFAIYRYNDPNHNHNSLNYVHATCGSTNYGYYRDNYIDVTVEISSTTQSNFLQIVFPNALKNVVQAVTRVRPRQPFALGNAIVALNPDSCAGHQNGGIMYGTGLVNVTNGGIWSNGCMRGNGHPNVTVTGAGTYGNELDLGNAIWNPPPTLVNYQIPTSLYTVQTPDCSDPAAHNVASLPANMSPGLYCMTGDLRITGNQTITGNGVTIYLATGGIDIAGTVTINISAPGESPNPSPAIPHLLFYLPPTNHSVVQLNGTSNTQYTGTILAPGSEITINGTNGTNAYHSQIIGWDVLVGGTADTYVTYEGGENTGIPTAMELYK